MLQQPADSSDDDEPDDEDVQLPKNEIEQQQVIESNEEIKQEDLFIRDNLLKQEQQIVSLDDNLKGKETLL